MTALTVSRSLHPHDSRPVGTPHSSGETCVTATSERPALTVIPGGRNQPSLVQVERAAWDELLISRTTASAERVAAAEQERRYLTAALAALYRPAPDVDSAERLLIAALRVATQEATRAAADIEPGPEPVEAIEAIAA